MGGDGCKNDGSGGISSQDSKTDYRNYSKEEQRKVMVVGLGGQICGGNRDLANKGVCE